MRSPHGLERLRTAGFEYSSGAAHTWLCRVPIPTVEAETKVWSSVSVWLWGYLEPALGVLPHCPSQGHTPKAVTSSFNPGPLLEATWSSVVIIFTSVSHGVPVNIGVRTEAWRLKIASCQKQQECLSGDNKLSTRWPWPMANSQMGLKLGLPKQLTGSFPRRCLWNTSPQFQLHPMHTNTHVQLVSLVLFDRTDLPHPVPPSWA